VISGTSGPLGPSGLEVVITVGSLKYLASCRRKLIKNVSQRRERERERERERRGRDRKERRIGEREKILLQQDRGRCSGMPWVQSLARVR